MKRNSNLNVRVNLAQRERFKRKCRTRGLTVEYAVSQLLQKAINDEVALGEVTKGKLVLNEK